MIDSVVFAGSPEAAVVVLDALVASNVRVVRVVTRPDVRRGRGSALIATPVKNRAVDLGIEVSYDVEDLICESAQAAVVVAYGRIIPKHVLETNPMINVHFSLLPRWRGAAPVERAILAGDAETGVCIMAMEETLDTGDVYARRKMDLADDLSAHEVTMHLAALGADALVDVLQNWPVPATPQIGEATYAKKISSDEYRIDWSQPSVAIARQVRALPAFSVVKSGRRLRVLSAVADTSVECSTLTPGSFLGGNAVATGQGALRLLTVQPEGKSAMSWDEWMRGARLTTDDILGEFTR